VFCELFFLPSVAVTLGLSTLSFEHGCLAPTRGPTNAFMRITTGCAGMQNLSPEMSANAGVSEANMMQYLGVIEEARRPRRVPCLCPVLGLVSCVLALCSTSTIAPHSPPGPHAACSFARSLSCFTCFVSPTYLFSSLFFFLSLVWQRTTQLLNMYNGQKGGGGKDGKDADDDLAGTGSATIGSASATAGGSQQQRGGATTLASGGGYRTSGSSSARAAAGNTSARSSGGAGGGGSGLAASMGSSSTSAAAAAAAAAGGAGVGADADDDFDDGARP
jgi:hypothetical protein